MMDSSNSTAPGNTTTEYSNTTLSSTSMPTLTAVTSFSTNATREISYGTSPANPTTWSSNGTTPNYSNSTFESGCLRILYEDIGTSRVRIWDVILLIPNLLFLLFLLRQFYKARGKLLQNLGGSSPIFTTYFALVLMTAVLSVIRCIVSMTVDVASTPGNDANKILWVILRFFLLMAEMSVLVFGLACGHLDSRSSIKRVLTVTTLLALIFSVTQGLLEMLHPDPKYEEKDEEWTVYGHGGALFSFVTSMLFGLVYVLVLLLPFCECVKKYLTVPTRKSFYIYASFMAVLNFCFALGSGLLFGDHWAGLCILDAASLAYFIFFAPFLYWTFLHSYFGVMKQNSVLFSYSAQVDEGLDDISDSSIHPARANQSINGVLVFDRVTSSSYHDSKSGVNELLHDLGVSNGTGRRESEQGDSSTVNFFKDVDLANHDDDLNFQ